MLGDDAVGIAKLVGVEIGVGNGVFRNIMCTKALQNWRDNIGERGMGWLFIVHVPWDNRY